MANVVTVRCCVLYAVCCVLRAACCVLYAACCVLRAACSVCVCLLFLPALTGTPWDFAGPGFTVDDPYLHLCERSTEIANAALPDV